jgi:hypothetical protein
MPGRHQKQRSKKKQSKRGQPSEMETVLLDSVHGRRRTEAAILKDLVPPKLHEQKRKAMAHFALAKKDNTPLNCSDVMASLVANRERVAAIAPRSTWREKSAAADAAALIVAHKKRVKEEAAEAAKAAAAKPLRGGRAGYKGRPTQALEGEVKPLPKPQHGGKKHFHSNPGKKKVDRADAKKEYPPAKLPTKQVFVDKKEAPAKMSAKTSAKQSAVAKKATALIEKAAAKKAAPAKKQSRRK